MDKDLIVIFGVLSMAIIGLGSVLMLGIPIEPVTKVETFELWYTQAPFGELYSDISGNFVWGSGSISTTPSEAYTVKYWQDGQLLSLTLDASKTPIIVDGTFQLVKTTTYGKNIYGAIIKTETTGSPTYTLHLPNLPDKEEE